MFAKVPVVVLSGSDLSEDTERAFHLGAVYYQVKPLETSHLNAILKQLSAVRDSIKNRQGKEA